MNGKKLHRSQNAINGPETRARRGRAERGKMFSFRAYENGDVVTTYFRFGNNIVEKTIPFFSSVFFHFSLFAFASLGHTPWTRIDFAERRTHHESGLTGK